MTNKLPNPKRKTPLAQNQRKITAPQTATDMFTLLCSQQLGAECVKEYAFYKPRKWRFDYALPAYKIALEVEGGVWTQGRHVRPKGFLNDMTKYNTAALYGWCVLRTTPDKLMSQKTLDMLKFAMKRKVQTVDFDNNA